MMQWKTASQTGTHCAIGVMAKAPQPGKSKTRLCPPLQPEEAAALSAAFLYDTTSGIQRAARAAPITGYAAYAPHGTQALLTPHLASGTKLVLADGSGVAAPGVSGFGLCLLHAIEGMLGDGHAAACVLSSDSPTLPSRLLVEAAAALLAPGERVVLGPSDDGGYYLLGMKARHAALFADIAWSTDSVAETTRRRARETGLELVEIETWFDVDDGAALARLLREAGKDANPATYAAIDRLGLWRHAAVDLAAE
jgi:rSAM/selenodomain-associated transferase 1